MADARDIIRRPIVTEKSNGLVALRKYTFEVDRRATKTQIKDAIESIFGVTVEKVNTCRYEGKTKRLGVHQGKRPDWKKAIVTLAEGDKIEIVEGL